MLELLAIKKYIKYIFIELENYAKSRGVTAYSQMGFYESDAFALRAYLSFSMPKDQELMVVSIDIKYVGDELEANYDIATGTGEIIAEGGPQNLGKPQEANFKLTINQLLERIGLFAEQYKDIIVHRLQIIQSN